MPQDLNRLFSDVRNARDVFVTRDGEIETSEDREANERSELRHDGDIQGRVRLKPEAFAGEAVAVKMEVLHALHAEAARHDGETGGLLVGPRDRVVTEFLPSGDAARRSKSSYELDVSHLQPLLDGALRRGLRFLGVWHSHPLGVSDLSAADLKTADGMLEDPDYGLNELLLPVSCRTRGGFETRFFIVTKTCETIVTPTLTLVAHGGDDSIPATIKATSERATERSPERPWNFLGTAPGLKRLSDEREQLEQAGWSAAIRRLDGGYAMLADSQGIAVALLFPPEFPIAPPAMRVELDGKCVPMPAPVTRRLRTWSSQSTTLSLVRACARALRPQKPRGALTRLATALGLSQS